MPQRKCNKTREKVTRVCQRIILPIEWEAYQEIVTDPSAYRNWLDQMIGTYPHLFPSGIEAGYTLHDKRRSKKMPDVCLRRIKLKKEDEVIGLQVVTIMPSAIMPYMTGYTDEVEKALFLRRFGVPFWGLSYVFGRDDSYWYRLATHFGQYEIVATTLKESDKLPQNLLADEKHVRFNGQKGYIATTVGENCILGASLSLTSDTDGLQEAYGQFKQEAEQVCPEYAPETVNTDGWASTQKAWQALFKTVTIIECFLHAFLKIRNCCKRKYRSVYPTMQQMVWDIYHASNKHDFWHQIRQFQHWGQQTLEGTALTAVQKLCAKAERFVLAFDYPEAYRTSNMVDRHMEPMARWLFSSRFFHGHWSSAEKQIRAWAICHNFWPYCPRSKISETYRSPAHQLNGYCYHENWLHNLLISTSLAGQNSNHKKQQN